MRVVAIIGVCVLAVLSGCATWEAGRAGAGHFTLSYRGDTRGLVKIPYGTSAEEMEARLNANPSRAADGPVTVERRHGSYIVTDKLPGSRAVIEVENESIAGIRNALAWRPTRGGVGTREIQKIDFIPDRPRTLRVGRVPGAAAGGR